MPFSCSVGSKKDWIYLDIGLSPPDFEIHSTNIRRHLTPDLLDFPRIEPYSTTLLALKDGGITDRSAF
jgi:hypothetical protein